jgi:hypothetical protein
MLSSVSCSFWLFFFKSLSGCSLSADFLILFSGVNRGGAKVALVFCDGSCFGRKHSSLSLYYSMVWLSCFDLLFASSSPWYWFDYVMWYFDRVPGSVGVFRCGYSVVCFSSVVERMCRKMDRVRFCGCRLVSVCVSFGSTCGITYIVLLKSTAPIILYLVTGRRLVARLPWTLYGGDLIGWHPELVRSLWWKWEAVARQESKFGSSTV